MTAYELYEIVGASLGLYIDPELVCLFSEFEPPRTVSGAGFEPSKSLIHYSGRHKRKAKSQPAGIV